MMCWHQCDMFRHGFLLVCARFLDRTSPNFAMAIMSVLSLLCHRKLTLSAGKAHAYFAIAVLYLHDTAQELSHFRNHQYLPAPHHHNRHASR